jgi:hypothetical protein
MTDLDCTRQRTAIATGAKLARIDLGPKRGFDFPVPCPPRLETRRVDTRGRPAPMTYFGTGAGGPWNKSNGKKGAENEEKPMLPRNQQKGA